MSLFRFIIFSFLFFAACTAPVKIERVEKQQYSFSKNAYASVDSSLYKVILPYKEKLDEEMDEVIGATAKPLTKGQPESLLGNFVADLCLEQANKSYKAEAYRKIDFCFLNNGGLRNNWPEGVITIRNAFEVMPFENELVVLSVNGEQVNKIVEWIGSKGGVPVSGIKMTLKTGIAASVYINNMEFNPQQEYKVVTSDYLANGGDNLFFLAEAKKEYINLKLRDAIINHCKELHAKKTVINPKFDNRISNE